MSAGELACIYSILMLHNDGIAITAEKINTILKAAGVTVESYWPSLFAKLAQNKSIDDLVLNVGVAGGAAVAVSAPAAVAAGGAAAAAAPGAEAKKLTKTPITLILQKGIVFIHAFRMISFKAIPLSTTNQLTIKRRVTFANLCDEEDVSVAKAHYFSQRKGEVMEKNPTSISSNAEFH
uniref:60S acidic ribosomal protein P1-like n=1 Tax=Cicer arietinum TaxID=3827 RepID=A0A3Q7WY24_CICAR|nr:60S acidic ribosomal protein P1-like [Cicer arietinum]